MATEIKIIRKKGFIINPNDEVVNNIFRELERKDGHCPTEIHKRNGHDQCPCADYLERDICHCKLYVEEKEDKIQHDDWGW